jgi:hypothetical protein
LKTILQKVETSLRTLLQKIEIPLPTRAYRQANELVFSVRRIGSSYQMEKVLGGGSGSLRSAAGKIGKSLTPNLIDVGSSKRSFACGRLKSISACETGISDVTGWDTEHEQLTADRDWLAPEAFPEWDPIRAPFIIGHMPPRIQHPQVQADWHDAGAPFDKNDT